MNTTTLTDAAITHPETAWIANAVPLWLAIGAIVLCALLLRGKLRASLRLLLHRRAARGRSSVSEAALLWTPPIVSEQRLLVACLAAALTVLVILSRVTPLFVALLLSGPAAALLIWLLLWMQEQRYVAALDRALPAAVGRLGAQLRSGSGIQPALAKVVADMPDSPLKAEWTFLLRHFGTPLDGGMLATPQQVVAALLAQTPSRRHVALLGHMEVALSQTHDVLIRRMHAAYTALHAAEQRRSQAATELSQMRYSGIAIGLAGISMAAYLALTQWTRFTLAYQGPLGLAVGLVVGTMLIAPFIGGFLLARADDLDY